MRRLYKLVEDGRSEVDDLLSERIADLKRAREKAHAALDRAKSANPTFEAASPIAIERFTRAMRESLTTGTSRSAKPTWAPSSAASRSTTARSGFSVLSKRCSRPSWRPAKARKVF